MSDLDDFYVHTATVETYEGTDGYGRDVFAAPATFSPAGVHGCYIEQKRRLVRDKDGAEVISETTLYTDPDAATLCVPGSRVTVDDAQSRVITVSKFTSGDLDLPDHAEVALT